MYANNSVISITDIGETEGEMNAVQCITDRKSCCGSGDGQWFFPNGDEVLSGDVSTISFYQNTGPDDGTVNLNRANTNVISPTGQFCCVMPDATLTYQTLCAIISKLMYVTSNNLYYLI